MMHSKFYLFLMFYSLFNGSLYAVHNDLSQELDERVQQWCKQSQGLFQTHQLCKGDDDVMVYYAREKAEQLLKKGDGDKAIPYLIYCENHYDEQTFNLLLSISGGCYSNISEKFKEFLAPLYKKGSATDLRNFYGQMTYRNKEHRKQPRPSLWSKTWKGVMNIFIDADNKTDVVQPVFSIKGFSKDDLLPVKDEALNQEVSTPMDISDESDDSKETDELLGYTFLDGKIKTE
ncbi:MAG: hypothetical protein H0U27_14415 [Nitrosopumilus sp.]|nr:hypothetical protein [Nitrosopumilus sp.]